MNILAHMIAAGTQNTLSKKEKDYVIVTNQVSLLLGVLPLIYIFLNVYNLGWQRITLPIITQPFFFVIPILINYMGFTTVSRVVVCGSMSVLALVFSIYNKSRGLDLETSHYMGIRFSILASSVVPFLVFPLRQWILIIVALLPSFIALIAFDLIHQRFGVGYYDLGLAEGGYTLTTMRVMIAYLLIVGGCLFLKSRVEKNEELNLELIRQLTEKNNKIQTQVEELSLQRDQISAHKEKLQGQFNEITNQAEQLHRNEIKLSEALDTIHTQHEVLVSQNKLLEFEVLTKNKELSQNNEQLVRYNNELQQFSYAVSHNLRGPVATILGLIHLIEQEQSNGSSPTYGHLKSTVNLLDETIQDLNRILDVRNAVTQVRQPVDLPSSIEKIKQTFKREIEEFGVLFVEEYRHSSTLFSVPTLINSILYNLVSNAIKYRSVNRAPHITVTTTEEDNSFRIRLRDNGVGLDVQAHQQKLFQLYKRFNNHTEGKGIGLYLIKLQTEILGGTIEVASEINSFTEFTILLPKTSEPNVA